MVNPHYIELGHEIVKIDTIFRPQETILLEETVLSSMSIILARKEKIANFLNHAYFDYQV